MVKNILLAMEAIGGKGNAKFATSLARHLNAQPGKKGESGIFEIELKYLLMLDL